MIKMLCIALALIVFCTGTVTAANISNPGIVNPYENFTVYSGDTLTINESDVMVLDYFSELIIEKGGTVVIYGRILTKDPADINNSGSIYNHGTFGPNDWGYLYNHGYIENTGYIPSSGNIINYELIENQGQLSNLGYYNLVNYGVINNTGQIYNSFSDMINYGTINNCGEINNHGVFSNDGTVYGHTGSSFSGEISGNQIQWIDNPSYEVPEFPTIALPMIAILGLAFIFRRRKD